MWYSWGPCIFDYLQNWVVAAAPVDPLVWHRLRFFVPFDAPRDSTLGQGGNLMVFLTEQNAELVAHGSGMAFQFPDREAGRRLASVVLLAAAARTARPSWSHKLFSWVEVCTLWQDTALRLRAPIWRSSAITSVVCEAQLADVGDCCWQRDRCCDWIQWWEVLFCLRFQPPWNCHHGGKKKKKEAVTPSNEGHLGTWRSSELKIFFRCCLLGMPTSFTEQNKSWGCIPDGAATSLRESPASVRPSRRTSFVQIGLTRHVWSQMTGLDKSSINQAVWMLQTQVRPGLSD